MKDLTICLITASETTQSDLSEALGQKLKDENLEQTDYLEENTNFRLVMNATSELIVMLNTTLCTFVLLLDYSG